MKVKSKLTSPMGEKLYLPFRKSKNGFPIRSVYKIDGIKYCSWCGENKVVSPAKKYCCKECKISAVWIGRWNSIKALIILRDKVCVLCGFRKPTPLYCNNSNWNELTNKGFNCNRSLYEIDDGPQSTAF